MKLMPIMRALILWLPILVQIVHAQERESQEKREPAPPNPRFFNRPVDYWQRGLSYEAPAPAKSQDGHGDSGRPSKSASRNDWTQAVRQQDGSFAYYELPKPLVDVLEDPSPEKIRAYFEWKLGRTQKILRAAEAMKEYRAGLAPAPGGTAGGDTAPPAANAVPSGPPAPIEKPAPAGADGAMPPTKEGYSVTYFHRAGCHHCETQDAVLAAWLKDKPGIALEVVEFGNKPELWRQYNVRGTPSLLIANKVSRKSIFLEGLSREDVLNQALRRAGSSQAEPPSSKEGESK